MKGDQSCWIQSLFTMCTIMQVIMVDVFIFLVIYSNKPLGVTRSMSRYWPFFSHSQTHSILAHWYNLFIFFRNASVQNKLVPGLHTFTVQSIGYGVFVCYVMLCTHNGAMTELWLAQSHSIRIIWSFVPSFGRIELLSEYGFRNRYKRRKDTKIGNW